MWVTHLFMPWGGAAYGATGAMMASIGRPVPVSLADPCQNSRYSLLISRLCLCSCHSSYALRCLTSRDRQFGMPAVFKDGFGQIIYSSGCGSIVSMTGSPVGAVFVRKSSPTSASKIRHYLISSKNDIHRPLHLLRSPQFQIICTASNRSLSGL